MNPSSFLTETRLICIIQMESSLIITFHTVVIYIGVIWYDFKTTYAGRTPNSYSFTRHAKETIPFITFLTFFLTSYTFIIRDKVSIFTFDAYSIITRLTIWIAIATVVWAIFQGIYVYFVVAVPLDEVLGVS